MIKKNIQEVKVKNLKVGDNVWTPAGYKAVTGIAKHFDGKVLVIAGYVFQLIGTPETLFKVQV